MFAIIYGLMMHYPSLLNSCGYEDEVYAQLKLSAIFLIASFVASLFLLDVIYWFIYFDQRGREVASKLCERCMYKVSLLYYSAVILMML